MRCAVCDNESLLEASSFISCKLLINSHSSTVNRMEPFSDIKSIVIVFGRPGAGKSTVSASVLHAFEKQQDDHLVKGWDLDPIIPDQIKENFAKGIYPTLEERNAFSLEAGKYVKSKLDEASAAGHHATIISFSFNNIDLRDNFRSYFPNATWVLIDTSEEEATRRIQTREGHFYKVDTSETSQSSEDLATPAGDRSEWKFADVDYQHIILDGNDPVEKNTVKLVEIIKNLHSA